MESKIRVPDRNQLIVDTWLEYVQNKPTVVFCTSVSHAEAEAATGAANGTLYRGDYHIPALYEKMLRTAAAAPEKFEGIEYLMRAISENGIIPDDFKRLYELFRRVVKLRGNSR